MFKRQAQNYLNVLVHDTSNRFKQAVDNEFKTDVRYILDKHMQMNNALLDKHVRMNSILMGFGFSAMGLGISILYDKSERDKDRLDAKIDRIDSDVKELDAKIDHIDSDVKELNTKIDRIDSDVKGLNSKIDMVLAAQKRGWFF